MRPLSLWISIVTALGCATLASTTRAIPAVFEAAGAGPEAISAVPEPRSMALFGLGWLALTALRRRRRAPVEQ